MRPQTLKGFRDFLPKEAKKRQYVINALKSVFELCGFEPLETPALEYEEILLGKYGEEGDKLLYRFEDLGGRRVALRYDQTVPLARVVAQYQNELVIPFKRYQIQPVWRAENPQKGRFREFLQCDADIVGINSPLADAEIITTAAKSLRELGFKDFKILINDRQIFSNIIKRDVLSEKTIGIVVRCMDKLKKIGREAVLNEMIAKGISTEVATYAFQAIEDMKPTENLQQIFKLLPKLGVTEPEFEFCPTLARGLDYYTSMIFEVEIEDYNAGSVCGGGRYDKLIGMFSPSTGSGQAGRDIPAVGFAFGFDRLIEAMTDLNMFPKDLTTTKILVTVFSKDLLPESIKITKQLRKKGINTEVYLDPDKKLDIQLKYADKKNIPYVVIVGPEEKEKGLFMVKNLKEKTQKLISFEELVNL